jgi:hypothetical protein
MIEKDTTIRKVRRIPAKGEVLVNVGDLVDSDAIVAKGLVTNPEVQEVKVYVQLGVDPEQAMRYMLKKEGDEVMMNEVIAINRSFFGRSTRVCRSPIDGTIEVFSKTSGRVFIRGKKIAVEVRAHISGRVIEVIPKEGAVVESRAAVIQGLFGVGGEKTGVLAMTVNEPDEATTTDEITEDHKGKILVGGSIISLEALRKATRMGVNGIIVGGVDQQDLTNFLGHEIGIGVTGKENTGVTLIITEGFGTHPMDDGTFSLLRSYEGRLACIDGTTQIRSRMLRPEIIIPL